MYTLQDLKEEQLLAVNMGNPIYDENNNLVGYDGAGFQDFNFDDFTVKNVFFSDKGGNVGINNHAAVFDVVCEPDVKLIEMPIYEKTVAVVDAPPVAPEVDIVPLNNKKNDIKINFYPGSINTELVPIALYPEDKHKFVLIRYAQDRHLFNAENYNLQTQLEGNLSGQEDFQYNSLEDYFDPEFYMEPKLKFKSDDFVTKYEIYRLDFAPESYLDFAQSGGKLQVLSSKEASSYTDKIDNNKKYYFSV